ncbi:MAG: serine hydrolase [Fuerstiella sp.]|nr:serine hydrolase [Fuerstiella sp.]
MKDVAIVLLGCCLLPHCQVAADEDQSPKTFRGSLSAVTPEAVGMNSGRLNVIDRIVAEGLTRARMPGCVVLVGHQGRTVFHKAYGYRQLQPEKVAMLTDTVFDLASLTKPVATATSVMSLVEQGKLTLDDAVAAHLPDFADNGKAGITVRQLLTHMGGLIPDNSMRDYDDGPAEAMRRVFALTPTAVPGEKFMYSDVGFIVLAELVKRITGEDVHQYSRRVIFGPLQMTETGFLPTSDLAVRAAVTQQRGEHWMQGEVHDPRAYALGGIAGHAGLFSTAADLARYAQAMINGGILDGVRVLQPDTVALMRSPVQVSSGLRTPGWDMKSPYSSNRGDLLSAAAFGHGGFTGTALWIDPDQKLFVVFLSNRVHPDGKGSVNALAGRICTVAASAVGCAKTDNRVSR